jgi:hypothetical protein
VPVTAAAFSIDKRHPSNESEGVKKLVSGSAEGL